MTHRLEFRVDFESFLRIVGASVRAHRRAAGLTQEDLADKLGVSTQWVSEVERGNGTASLDFLYKLADVLDTSVSELVRTGEDIPVDNDDVREIVAMLLRMPPDVARQLSGLLLSVENAARTSNVQ